MKVGYVAPMSVAAVNGGLRTQALYTIEHVRKLGIEPVLLTAWDNISDQKLDLIHVFGASVENLGIVDKIYALNIPMILSPVFFSNKSSRVIKRAIKVDEFISVFGSGIRSDFSIKANICRKADLIAPNTSDEALLIESGFSIDNDKIKVIPNGVEERFSNSSPDLFIKEYGIKEFVLFAGQAGAKRKNVIKLIEVAEQIDAPVVIIGSFYDDDYGNKCLRLASKLANVTLIETLDHDSELLASAYAASKVFMLPSQFETPGIAAMEAALTGSRIVITQKGGTKEYFGNHAEYIDPSSSTSLLRGIQNALAKEQSEDLKDHILQNYTWDKVAKMTVQHYQTLIK